MVGSDGIAAASAPTRSRAPKSIIVSHAFTDFDGFAAMVAAQLLDPTATLVLPRSLGRDLRHFLALHKDRFAAIDRRDVDPAAVERIVIVDVRRASRLRESLPAALLERVVAADESLDVEVWDHHPPRADDVPARRVYVDPVGSVTTLLVEAVRARGLALRPALTITATLLALGIHADTGSLTYAGTTARDAAALAWLLEQGANLRMINRYLAPPFTDGQREALVAVLEAVDVVTAGGVAIGLAAVELARGAHGLDVVTSEALALSPCAALFTVFGVRGRKCLVIARSRPGVVDVRGPLRALGGGGHASAASATVHDERPATVAKALREALEAAPPEVPRVAAVMRTPAPTLAHDLPLVEAAQRLLAAGVRGAAVLRDGALRGVITVRDLARARRRGDHELPVASCMSHHLHTTTPGAPLERALALMTAHDVGHLPVLDPSGALVGLLTRDDLLRALYPEDFADEAPGAAPI
jgi:tRNA nucleotidyltransferase (CCA-adding enzyme)